jgi:hypothetical protein
MWEDLGKRGNLPFDENKKAKLEADKKKKMLQNSVSKDMFVEGARVRGTTIGQDEKGKATRWFQPR